jgi:ketosteroid isomerase-like protein
MSKATKRSKFGSTIKLLDKFETSSKKNIIMKAIKLLAIGLLAQLSSCGTPDNISEAERTAIAKEIQGRLDGYADAVKRKDLEWVQKFWSNEKDFVLASDGKINTNYDSAITKEYRDAFTTIKEMTHLNFSNGHALVLSKNAVSYTTNFNWQAIMVSGDTVKANGSWLYLFKKSDEQWKVVHSAGTHIYN